jgi:hypothetical protein
MMHHNAAMCSASHHDPATIQIIRAAFDLRSAPKNELPASVRALRAAYQALLAAPTPATAAALLDAGARRRRELGCTR